MMYPSLVSILFLTNAVLKHHQRPIFATGFTLHPTSSASKFSRSLVGTNTNTNTNTRYLAILLDEPTIRKGHSLVACHASDEHNDIEHFKMNNPLVSLGQSIQVWAQRFLQHRAVIGTAVILFLSLLTFPSKSIAAQSGGRIGGGSFRSSDRQRYSTTRMATPYRTRSSLWNDGLSRPYSSTNILINPYPSSYFWNPFRSPLYYGRTSGIAITSPYPSPFEVLILGGALYFMVQGLFKTPDTWNKETFESALGSGISVAKISVALQIPNREDPNSILNVLKRLGATANTGNPAGLQTLTHQVALEILRRKQSIVASSTSYKHFDDMADAQREYNKLSIQERSKFERETVSNYNGVDYGVSSATEATNSNATPSATYAVVTIVLAISGDTTVLPKIRAAGDIETSLSRIAVDAQVEDCFQSSEILWTPTESDEILTKRDILVDYPELVFI